MLEISWPTCPKNIFSQFLGEISRHLSQPGGKRMFRPTASWPQHISTLALQKVFKKNQDHQKHTCHHLSTVPSTSLRIQTDAYLASPVGFHHGARQKGEQLRTCLSAKAPGVIAWVSSRRPVASSGHLHWPISWHFKQPSHWKATPWIPHVVATLFVSETEGPWPTRWDWSLSATLFTQSLPSSGHLRMDQTDVSPTWILPFTKQLAYEMALTSWNVSVCPETSPEWSNIKYHCC